VDKKGCCYDKIIAFERVKQKTIQMKNYPSDLSNSQWQVISSFLKTNRKRKHSLREIVNAVLYLTKTGCQWRMLPKDFPNWQLVYYYFSTWKKDGTIEDIQLALVEKIRSNKGRAEEPTVGIIDSQSVKTTLVSSENTGFDPGKKIKGHKRHIIVDTLGLVLCVVVHSASVQDRDGAIIVLTKLTQYWKKIIKIFADGGYRGQLVQQIKKQFRLELEIIKRDNQNSFKVLPKRWIVERTFAWFDTNRRNSKNYERLLETTEAIAHLSAIRIMLKHF
jgi:putative transposase